MDGIYLTSCNDLPAPVVVCGFVDGGSVGGHHHHPDHDPSRGRALGLKIEDRLFNAKYAENRIVSQAPGAGDSTKAGQDLHVLVSLGTPRVTVPTLVGVSVRAAQVTANQR